MTGEHTSQPKPEPDLNEIARQAKAGELPPMDIGEAFARGGHHDMHFVNPEAHPDEDVTPLPSLEAIRAAHTRAQGQQDPEQEHHA